MNKKPPVSIGMPVFNGEKYLERALDSLLNQTFSDFELIISDNASTDRTQEICQVYITRDKRIRYYRNSENLGAAQNYNHVFELSSGEYFKWAAHDDLCAPEYLERCFEILKRDPEVVLCYPKTVFIDEHEQVIEYYDDGFNLRSPKPYQRFRDSLRAASWCNPVTGLMRVSTLKKTLLIGNYASSDKVLLAELALFGKFYEIPEYLFLRRLHEQSSVAANPSDDERAVWFDPATKGKTVAPRWKRFLEHLKSIRRAPLNKNERVYCYIELMRFYLALERLKGVRKDLWQAARTAPHIFFKHK